MQLAATSPDRISAQEQGLLGSPEWGDAILSRVVFARASSGKSPHLEIFLENGFVFNFQGEPRELEAEFARIVASRQDNTPLLDLSGLPLSADKLAVDPAYVKSVNSVGLTAGLAGPPSSTSLKMRFDAYRSGETERLQDLGLRRNNDSRLDFHGYCYGGHDYRRQIEEMFASRG